MLVFGDRVRSCCPTLELQAIARSIDALERMPCGVERHSLLVALLIAVGELAQAVADERMQARRRDSRDPSTDALMALAVWLARRVWRSHRSGYRDRDPPALAQQANGDAKELVARAAATPLPGLAVVKAPEGFAEYALYPEEYGAAAAPVFSSADAPLVIGIRSVGTTLAAMVASVSGRARDVACPVTVRPIGHPYARRLALDADLEREIARAGSVAIADEGPGLSGSSFAAVLDALASAGVPDANVHVFPSRLGLGPLATPAYQRRWRAVGRHRVSFDELFVEGGPRASSLRAWTEALTGEQDSAPLDVGGGRWRSLLFASPARWPPAHTQLERRKFLLGSSGRRFLARFVGLGRYGEHRRRRAVRLAGAGFSPGVLGLRQGFLVQPWLEGAAPLSERPNGVARRELVARVADYLAFRAVEMPADAARGATCRELLDMAITNAAEALGPKAGDWLRGFEGFLPDIQRAARPIEIDGRLHAWEWLVLPDGALLKTDAIDHCDAHDLVGCQDVAWDLAGATIELELSPPEVAVLRRRLASAGAAAPEAVIAFYQCCYLAFQLGAAALAASALEGDDAVEADRQRRASQSYAARLAAVIARDARVPFAAAAGDR